MAHHGSTYPQEAVILTHPANSPFVKALKSNLISLCYPVIRFLIINVNNPEAHGDNIVFTIANDALSQPSLPIVSLF